MSKKNEIKSVEAASESRAKNSVFDFLYHDNRRIASYLAQLDELGHLQQITRTDQSGEAEGRNTTTAGNLGIPGALGGKIESGTEAGSTHSETSQRTYDPFWANAIRFLDLLTERGMIQRDLTSADIGQFVLAKGSLTVLDLAMFKDAWKLPSVQRKVMEGAFQKPKSTMTTAQKAEVREQKENAELMLDMIQIMPHSVHASMITSGNDQAHLLWCTLKEEYLVTPAADMTLAHGATMPGEWAILGILSAKPEYQTHDPNGSADDGAPGVMQSVVGQVSKTIAPIVRLALGRPAAAHAVTPLLVFREVS